MRKLRTVLFCLALTLLYGVVHDEITGHLSPAYFILGHARIFSFSSPSRLYLAWGLTSAFPVGLLFGILLAEITESPGLRPERFRAVAAWVVATLGLTALAATGAERLGDLLARRDGVLPPLDLVTMPLSRAERIAFVAVWFAHGASYLVGCLGGTLLLLGYWRKRDYPQIVTLFPRTGWAGLRAGLLLLVFALLGWVRWFRS